LAPEIESGRVTAVGERAITLRVRHAQDIDADRFEGDWD
jgi:hypothetical protein